MKDENESLEELFSNICDRYCKYPGYVWNDNEMEDTICCTCPLVKLWSRINNNELNLEKKI